MPKDNKNSPDEIGQWGLEFLEKHSNKPKSTVDDPDFGTLVPYGFNYMVSSVANIDGFGEVKWEMGVSRTPKDAERIHFKFMRDNFAAIWQVAWPTLIAARERREANQILEAGHFCFSVNAPEEGSALEGAEWSIQVEHEDSDGMWFIEFTGLELTDVSAEY